MREAYRLPDHQTFAAGGFMPQYSSFYKWDLIYIIGAFFPSASCWFIFVPPPLPPITGMEVTPSILSCPVLFQTKAQHLLRRRCCSDTSEALGPWSEPACMKPMPAVNPMKPPQAKGSGVGTKATHLGYFLPQLLGEDPPWNSEPAHSSLGGTAGKVSKKGQGKKCQDSVFEWNHFKIA